MSRNEIRLRRKMMTSRRIERHKNFHDLMKRHERQIQLRKVGKILLVLFILLALTGVLYWLSGKKSTPTMESGRVQHPSYQIVLKINVPPKHETRWKHEKTPGLTSADGPAYSSTLAYS
jgi:hypothetical protein